MTAVAEFNFHDATIIMPLLASLAEESNHPVLEAHGQVKGGIADGEVTCAPIVRKSRLEEVLEHVIGDITEAVQTHEDTPFGLIFILSGHRDGAVVYAPTSDSAVFMGLSKSAPKLVKLGEYLNDSRHGNVPADIIHADYF